MSLACHSSLPGALKAVTRRVTVTVYTQGLSHNTNYRLNRMMSTQRRVLLLCLAAAVASAADVCPDIEKAPKNFILRVTDYELELPDGKLLPQKAYNDSVVGPALVMDLGDDVSIDVTNELASECESAQIISCAF